MTTYLDEPANARRVDSTAPRRRSRSLDAFWDDLQRHRRPGGRLVIGVDGRSGSGKSTLASVLARRGDHTAVVHTDDVAWHHSFFGWSHLLIDNVLEPYHDGRTPIRYVPRAWQRRGRSGAITVPAATCNLIVEGVGAAARDVRRLLDVVIWVETPAETGRDRVVARGVDSPAFIDDWLTQERAFLDEHRPWEAARFIVDGTADASGASLTVWVGEQLRTGVAVSG